MPKRKRITAVGDFLTTKVKKHDIAGADESEGEDFDSELTPIEEDSQGSNSEPSGNKKSKKKATVTKKKVLGKVIPEGNPAVSRKDRIKTEDENGDPIIRTPQVNSDYLPLPWKGRLGYVSKLQLFHHPHKLIIPIGMSEYIPPHLEPSNLLLTHLPNIHNPSKGLGCEWAGIRRIARPPKCVGPGEDDTLE